MKTDYQTLISQAKSLIEGESDLIANMANLSALLFNGLHDVNWAGFYRVDGEQLVLGPFQGLTACIRINMGKGVCGTAAHTGSVQVVDDVHQFSGHIACDASSNSEIVIPIRQGDKIIGVLDIDSPRFARFDQQDSDSLQKIVKLLEASIV